MSESHPLLGEGTLIHDGRIQVSVSDGVALIRLNRPEKLNAFDAEQIAAFERALRWLANAHDVRVAVIAGAGRAFCTGGDISTYDEIDVESGFPFTRRGYDILRPLETGEHPVIAAVEGYCLAGGLEVALACDFIIAGEGASFGFAELELGLIPGWGGTARLARAVPIRMARQMILGSERIGTERAANLGLVNEVTAKGDAVARALNLADRIASLPPIAVRTAKLVTQQVGDGAPAEAALAAERVGAALLFGTAAVHERSEQWVAGARETSYDPSDRSRRP
jgi:enoyl-CoA hydratase